MEDLSGLVGGERHKGLRGVPAGIDTGGENAVVLDGNLMSLTTIGDDGAAVGSTYVKQHPLGVVVLIVVAVHTMVLVVVVAAVVLVDGGLREVGQVALVESQLTVELVAWLDEAVGEERVDGFLGHRQAEGGVAHPTLPPTRVHAYFYIFTALSGEQAAPGGGVDIHLAVRAGTADESAEVSHKGIRRIVHYHEVQRGDIGRDGDIAVVGIDACAVSHLGEGGGEGGGTAAAGTQKRNCYGDKTYQ